MSDSDRPPENEGKGSEPPPSPRSKESRRSRLEGVIPEIVKRAVELGVEKARESPETVKAFVGDLKLPKEIAHYVFGQIDETKNGLFRVVANEIRDFLEHTNFSGEMQKILTTVQFEVNTTIRFTPNDQKKKKKGKAEAPRDDESDPTSEELRAGEDEEPSEPDMEGEDEDRGGMPTPEVKTTMRSRRPKST